MADANISELLVCDHKQFFFKTKEAILITVKVHNEWAMNGKEMLHKMKIKN